MQRLGFQCASTPICTIPSGSNGAAPNIYLPSFYAILQHSTYYRPEAITETYKRAISFEHGIVTILGQENNGTLLLICIPSGNSGWPALAQDVIAAQPSPLVEWTEQEVAGHKVRSWRLMAQYWPSIMALDTIIRRMHLGLGSMGGSINLLTQYEGCEALYMCMLLSAKFHFLFLLVIILCYFTYG